MVKMIIDHIHGNAEQIAAERSFFHICVKIADEAQKRLLRKVIRQIRIAAFIPDEPVDVIIISFDQRLHALFVAAADLRDEFLIAHCYPSCILSIVQPDPAKKRFRKTIFYAQRCIGTATVRPMTEAPLSPAPPP